MFYNTNLDSLHPYPFAKLKTLKQEIATLNQQTYDEFDNQLTKLSIGEPQGKPSEIVLNEINHSLGYLAKYPSIIGLPELRQAIQEWAKNRFNASLNSVTQILPLTGTREGLFAIAQVILGNNRHPKKNLVLMPNPFYQIYEGAAIMAGGKPVYLNNVTDTYSATNPLLVSGQPDFVNIADEIWQQTAMIYICNPANPSGACLTQQQIEYLINKARQFDFYVIFDECYSEIYSADDDKVKPLSGLEIAQVMSNNDHNNQTAAFNNVLVFHSLSKRSNLAGLRSGFVAGDTQLIAKFLLYRTYHGCAMSIVTQKASIIAWQDEQHVQDNIKAYTEKFNLAKKNCKDISTLKVPDASFYLWLDLSHINLSNAQEQLDLNLTKYLLHKYKLEVLPGSFLARNCKANTQTLKGHDLKQLGEFNHQQTIDAINPGQNFVRIALVAELKQLDPALTKLNTAWLELT